MKYIYKILSIIILLLVVIYSPLIVSAENIAHSSSGWFGGPVTSPYGDRVHPIRGTIIHHDGIDLGIDENVKAPAAADGTVIFSGWAGGYGNYIEIQMADGTVYAYGHLNDRWVNEGDKVKKGDIVGLVGSTGDSTGPHMHIEYRVNGIAVDPYNFYINAGWTLDGAAPYEKGIPGKNQKNYKDEIIDFKSYFEFTFNATNTFNDILSAITKGINFIQSYILGLLLSLITLDLIIRYTYSILNNNKEDFLQSLTKRLFNYTIITLLISSWKIIIEGIKELSFNVADTAYMGLYNSEYLISDPSIIIQQIGLLYSNYINNSVYGIVAFSSPSAQAALMALPGISQIFEFYYALIITILIITLLFACYIVCYVSWTIIYFYLTTLCCLIGLPFSAFKITEKQPAMMYKSLGLQALHLTIIAMTFNMMYTYISELSANDVSLSSLLLCMVNIGCLAIFFPTITSKINGAFSGD